MQRRRQLLQSATALAVPAFTVLGAIPVQA